jgi:hypothetical protein
MGRTSTTSIKLAHAGLGLLLVWNVVRAFSQAVTQGEAWNYLRYIEPPWTQVLAGYESNNHVLNTLLVRISTARLHTTEWTLRLPSLLFGVLYMRAAYRVARRWFDDGTIFLAVLGLLVLNPLVVDGMSEGRGYGMALACWMWALALVSETPAGAPLERRTACIAGVLAGLSVTASLAFAAPVAGLLLITAWRHRFSYMPHLAGLTAFVLLVVPLNHAEASVVTAGATSLRQTLNELTAGSFGVENAAVLTAARIAVGAIVAMALWFGFRRAPSELVCVGGASTVAVFAFLLAAHRWAHAAFPEAGAIYLVPLITLFAAGLAVKSGREPVQISFLVVSALCVAHYVDHFRFPYRAGEAYAGGRDLAMALRTDAGDRGVRIGAAGDAEAILRFYKVRLRRDNWHTIEAPKPEVSYDYYVVGAQEAADLERQGRRIVYRDNGLILAR